MTTTEDTTPYVVIANLLLQPLLQYLLHSRCTHVEMGCIKCQRTVLEKTKNNAQNNSEDIV